MLKLKAFLTTFKRICENKYEYIFFRSYLRLMNFLRECFFFMLDIPKTAEGDRTVVSSKESRQTEQKEEDKTVDEEEEKTTNREEEEAATRIQAAFRGHHARKSMKDTETSTKQTESKSDSEPTKEQLLKEFREDDKGEFP